MSSILDAPILRTKCGNDNGGSNWEDELKKIEKPKFILLTCDLFSFFLNSMRISLD